MKLASLSIWALSRESVRFWKAFVGETGLLFPQRLLHALLLDTQLLGGMDRERISEIVGATVLSLFNNLGPIYGKVAQTALTRLPQNTHDLMDRLQITRLYSDWPAIPFADIENILDQEIPFWRKHLLSIDSHPLGVASMAQVHAAKGHDGQDWVVKIIKPDARSKLRETIAAVEELADKLDLIALTKNMKRYVDELRLLTNSLLLEVDLARERQNILKVSESLRGQQGVLRIPAVFDAISNENVIVLQRFKGIRLSDVVTGKADLSDHQRARLARGVLKELLVHVFELGVFHADPHAGNLILLEDDSVGLFDWGLAGELDESGRRHIAAILRSVMLMDFDRLTEALSSMAEENARYPDKERLKRDLEKLSHKLQKSLETSRKNQVGNQKKTQASVPI